MTGMQGRLVLNQTLGRRESCLQPLADAFGAAIGLGCEAAHSASFMYFDRNRLWPMMNTNIRPMLPNILKLTQVSSG